MSDHAPHMSDHAPVTLRTTTTTATTAEQYALLRTSVGWCTPYASLVRIEGMERADVLARLLARDSAYVEPDTVRDSLVLEEDGAIRDVVTHIELDESSWLFSPSRPDLAELVRETVRECGVAEAVTVTDAAEDHAAVAFEGPASWRIAERLLDEEISGLVLHGVGHVRLDGTDCVMARTGTTGEYGYLLIAPRPADAAAWVAEQARSLGGGRVDADALARARGEVRHPVLPELTEGLSVREAGLEWLVSWGREDPFRGAAALASCDRRARGLTPVLLAASEQGPAPAPAPAPASAPAPAPGTAVYAGDRRVGEVRWCAPAVGAPVVDAPAGGGPAASGGPALAFAVLDAPFDVPGLDLVADGGTPVRTVSSPVVVPTSWSERLGD
ncbi:hypothetical protein [Streptomyces sp. NPDC059009]|uniref:hypothetical protein n=1 Tax=Streptomyces sp. NPDC059009 TaxID=3346694 RepID=UPI00368EE948